MAKLITTEQLAKLLENEYDIPLGVACYTILTGITELQVEYVADSVTITEKGKTMNMPMGTFKKFFSDAHWVVNTIGELSSTEIGMAVDYIISKENSNEQE